MAVEGAESRNGAERSAAAPTGSQPFRSFRKRPLAVQLIASYLVILGVGGLIAFSVGSWRVSKTFMEQGQRTALHDLAAARAVYEQRLDALDRTVEMTAANVPFAGELADPSRRPLLERRLEMLRRANGFDVLNLTDESGRVLISGGYPERSGLTADPTDSAAVGAGLSRLVRAALAGRSISGSELVRRSGLPPRAASDSTSMVVLAAAPVRGPDGHILGALYGGILLDGDTSLVDRVKSLVYRGERLRGRDVGSVAVFRGDVAVATTLRSPGGQRALGDRAPEVIRDRVLRGGDAWNGVAALGGVRYVSADEPIRSSNGEVIGILHVGLLEDLFGATRDRLILTFFVIAFLGFIGILSSTYWMIRRITQPLVEMSAAARRVTAGHLDQNVESDLPGEAGVLAESFNTMTASLRQMKGDLEEWGRTLEEKVHQRTEELVLMQARVAQSERLASVGMLASGVAHEINNPLGGILALSSLALEDMQPENPARPNLEEVVRQTERCRDIVKGLLEFSRQSKAGTESVDVHDVLEGTLALIGSQSLFFNVHVVKNFAPGIPHIVADRSQLQQVFTNLLVNAAQAMDERGTITMATRYSATDGHVEVSVSDTGKGIAPELLDRIFDPFFTTKESGKGTGLGLSIVYGIVTQHGGTIKVASAGAGTTFTVRFPAAEAPAMAPAGSA